ncbi:hypothetical protein [Streptacidiphilus carbonis]|jgi:hypothetical protein|uniref:hypothetical protein n=1 Tax=Streptacidiphilus carbonis TaxID=105422 RepID=UPI0005AA797B|nr:hypothetical protein [Streptacidiphilus carbonis]
MAFTSSSEPFQEPPRRRSRGHAAIGVAVLLMFCVPLLILVTAGPRTATDAAGPVAGAGSDSPTAAPSARPAGALGAPSPRVPRSPRASGSGAAMPPLPPPGAPWPPPPGAPVPPVCALEYRVDASGGTTWTAMTAVKGELSVQAVSAGAVHRQDLKVDAEVGELPLSAELAQDHALRATLSPADGTPVTCLVGPQD